jgi:Helix-turn-helix domain
MEYLMIDLKTCSDHTLLSTAEVAEALNISEGSVRKFAKDGRLRVIGGFRVLYFSARAVREFVDSGERGADREGKRADGQNPDTGREERDGEPVAQPDFH